MSQTPYKILGISSGRPVGNAEVILRECLMECEKIAPAEVRITRLRSLKIGECNGCLKCLGDAAEGGNGCCPLQDDLEWLKEQILWADAVIFSAPSFCYIPTSEVITLMNRAMGCGKDYLSAVRAQKKPVGLICVGGSDTVDFNLPMQYAAFHAVCPGFELVDQFYANWIRGKGYIAAQPYHMERARLQAKRMMNRLMGYPVPAPKARIMKLNPMEYKDDIYVELEPCPVCNQSVVQMENTVFANGKFRCAVCGSTGHVEHHGGTLTYVWEDDTVAHNRLHSEFSERYVSAYQAAHSPVAGEKSVVAEFPVLTPGHCPEPEKPRLIALIGGSAGGTSELLARKALETATADGQFEAALIRVNELNIRFCTGCLLCKVNSRYRGGEDRCILKDDDLWVVEQLVKSAGFILSLDSVNGFTYGKVVSLLQRFGHGAITRRPSVPRANAVMISSFDDEVKNVQFAATHLQRIYSGFGPRVAREAFTCVPLTGDGILAMPKELRRAAAVGTALRKTAAQIMADPDRAFTMPSTPGTCPSCGLDLIELHPDLTVSCAQCDAHGKFEHRFGENVIVWDDYSVTHSRTTMYGGMLHFKHIDFSQSDDNNVLNDPKIHAELLAPYVAYGRLASPRD